MPFATINDVRIEAADLHSLSSAAVEELLRQRAVDVGLLTDDASDDALASALEQLLEQEVHVPVPEAAELARYYEAHQSRYSAGELVWASHILLQMTPGMPVQALLARAEGILHYVQAHPDHFEASARENSNCPSAETGGNLGQLQRGDTVPEFEQSLFADQSVGIWPQLVRTRYGFHILRIDRREPGKVIPLDAITGRVRKDLQRQALDKALAQYISVLAGAAKVEGVTLDQATSPLLN
ncbi:peptidylprolyl isomerase [Silvimonas iriomotensis]|uniref:peptidylprolyl isomerase n=1 Tax=Silvimonas iriomotensis TaxID=449662 RepID=A0ABQ2PCK3_9NEIS|nr:peptidylprolyl isomerase [Silvimonas iriomotensis]GGP23269.1 peptidyl-prolyl cis-trans isomerase [Silvimonas iriomotensis]